MPSTAGPVVVVPVRAPGDRGVRFEVHDLPGLRTVDHVRTADGTESPWLTDFEGRVLCLHQLTGRAPPSRTRNARNPPPLHERRGVLRRSSSPGTTC